MKSFIYFRLLSKHHSSQQFLLTMGSSDHQTILTSGAMNCSPGVLLSVMMFTLLQASWSCLLHSLLISAQTRKFLIVISLPDTNHDHLNSLLGFLHTGQLKSSKDGAPSGFSKIAFWYRKLDLLLLSEHSWLKIISFRSLFLYEWFRIWTATTWSES